MRERRGVTADRWNLAPILLLAVLFSWLVLQNAALLLLWSWPALPALMTVARALLKAAGIVAIQLLPAALLAAGVAMLWFAARRGGRPTGRRLEEVRHG